MALTAFTIAALLLLAGVVLWGLDSRRRVRSARGIQLAPKPHRLELPGAQRRERRAWAEEKGFTFARQDDYLVDEWSRGAAATGAPPRNIVSGSIYGHDIVLMDLDDVTVMAMRTGEVSDAVVDMRRKEFDDPLSSSDDLIRVAEVQGFSVYATDAGMGERFVDKRVYSALEVLPPKITAVWMESDWVLAQTSEETHAKDWEEMLAPLALLADAARVLPPREAPEIQPDLYTPSRPMSPPPPAPAHLEVVEDVGPKKSEMLLPHVVRPEEPLAMPTRVMGTSRGSVPPREVGLDNVVAIADGQDSEQGDEEALNDAMPRMPRRKDNGPSIFDSSASESPEREQ